jgi:capsular polysaccharide biosynthesis protein
LTAGDVYRALWRHKIFIVVLTAVFVAATVYATLRQSVKYEGSTLVRVQERGPSVGNASDALQASQDLALTYAKIIDSGALKEEVVRLVPPGIARQRASEATLSGDPVQDLDLLSITAKSTNSASAALAASMAPRALRSFIRRTSSGSERIIVIKPATTSSAVSRHVALNAVIALMLGLIFNGALALLIELFRDRLPEPEELGQAVGHPVLATIPTLRFRRERPSTQEDSVAELEQSLDRETVPPARSSRGGQEP